MQAYVLAAFIGLSAVVLIVMLGIAVSSLGRALPQDQVQPRGYAIRRWWFFALAALMAGGLAVSLPRLPYVNATELKDAMHISVVTRQFSYDMPAQLPLDETIVFDVTSVDVNHGFGIYDPHGRLVAQVQAMPGYVNHLTLTFREKGTYTVRCMEFCGVGHAAMKGSFVVA